MKNDEGLATNNNQRIFSIDVMRGVAILGIFLVNMLSFHSPISYFDPLLWWDETGDRIAFSFINIFAEGSFYPLFSFLFGYSFVLFYQKTERQHLSFSGCALRRLGFLLIIGIIHAFLFWHGDILINYAVFGFILFLFIKNSGSGLVKTGILLWLIPALLLTILVALTLLQPDLEMNQNMKSEINQSISIYQNGTFWEITQQRVNDWYAVNNLINLPFLFLMIFPLMLMGAGMAKLKWLERPNQYNKQFNVIILVSFVVGFGLKTLPFLGVRNDLTEFTQYIIGGVVVAVFYAALLVKISFGKHDSRLLRAIASIGKMSMTNYLLQSVVATLIFYGYGLGQYGKMSAWLGTVLVFFIFTLQLLISHAWLQAFKSGPVEWVWRRITYYKTKSHIINKKGEAN